MLITIPKWIPKDLISDAKEIRLPNGPDSLVAGILYANSRFLIVIRLEEKIGIISA